MPLHCGTYSIIYIGFIGNVIFTSNFKMPETSWPTPENILNQCCSKSSLQTEVSLGKLTTPQQGKKLEQDFKNFYRHLILP